MPPFSPHLRASPVQVGQPARAMDRQQGDGQQARWRREGCGVLGTCSRLGSHPRPALEGVEAKAAAGKIHLGYAVSYLSIHT